MRMSVLNEQMHLCDSCRERYPMCIHEGKVDMGDIVAGTSGTTPNVCCCSAYRAGVVVMTEGSV